MSTGIKCLLLQLSSTVPGSNDPTYNLETGSYITENKVVRDVFVREKVQVPTFEKVHSDTSRILNTVPVGTQIFC